MCSVLLIVLCRAQFVLGAPSSLLRALFCSGVLCVRSAAVARLCVLLVCVCYVRVCSVVIVVRARIGARIEVALLSCPRVRASLVVCAIC